MSSEIHKNYNLTVKLHPGSLDNKELIGQYFTNTKAKILKDANTHSLIFKNDLIITTNSTVGNEAIAFYKPLVQISLKGIDTVMEYELFNCSHVISNEKDLRGLLKNTELLNSKKENYKSFIDSYFYRLDGDSKLRIKNYIINS
jgi:CDP-glycerol glycerophosphotransferase (TagB/SpsB family)